MSWTRSWTSGWFDSRNYVGVPVRCIFKVAVRWKNEWKNEGKNEKWKNEKKNVFAFIIVIGIIRVIFFDPSWMDNNGL